MVNVIKKQGRKPELFRLAYRAILIIFEYCPVSDGAVSLLVTSDHNSKSLGSKSVRITGTGAHILCLPLPGLSGKLKIYFCGLGNPACTDWMPL